MVNLSSWLTLPTSVLTLLCSPVHAAEEARWLQDREQRSTWQMPLGVKKMGVDAGEKFFLEYWAVEEAGQDWNWNGSSNAELRQAVAMHEKHEHRRAWRLLGRHIFRRDFRCPTGTESCSSIGSSLCCDAGQTCIKTSEGVGCCPSGENCGNDIAACDEAAGYTSCPNSPNGGCCIPGASCLDIGCVLYGTDTVVVRPSTSYATSTWSSSPTPTTYTTDHTEVVIITITESGSVVTTTVVSATTVTIFPPSTSSSPTLSSSIPISPATANQPIRPTSSAASTITYTSTSLAPVSGCPTGFYMCSAVYLGGCCRVNRNCDTTSCPPTATETVVATNGVTVGADGIGATTTESLLTGQCASGWQTCAPDVGGGCCPQEYVCGRHSCSATVTGESNTGKEAPSEGTRKVVGSGFVVAAACVGIGMILL